MGLINTIQTKTEQARAKERIRPLLESRMMRDILLEIGQRGNEALDPQSVPLAMRRRATQLASESGLSGLKQCAVDELHLDESGITLVCNIVNQICSIFNLLCRFICLCRLIIHIQNLCSCHFTDTDKFI